MNKHNTPHNVIIGYIVLSILLLVTVIKCNAQEYIYDASQYYEANKTAENYAEEFLVDARTYNAQFYRTSRPTLQYVNSNYYVYINGVNTQVEAYANYIDRTITFDVRSYTYNYNLKVLVYHELGHYYLGREHTNGRSIMNDDIWQVQWIHLEPNDQSYFIKELFK